MAGAGSARILLMHAADQASSWHPRNRWYGFARPSPIRGPPL